LAERDSAFLREKLVGKIKYMGFIRKYLPFPFDKGRLGTRWNA
jgi:hypothetical protein